MDQVVLTAVRAASADADDAQSTVRSELLSLLSVIGDDPALIISIIADPRSDALRVRCALRGSDDGTLAAVLEAGYSTAPTGSSITPDRRWHLQPARPPVGFAGAAASRRFDPPASIDGDDWCAMLAAHPGTVLEVRVTPGGSGRRLVAISLAADAQLPVRIRALAASALPGLVLREDVEPVALDVDERDAARLLPLPRTIRSGLPIAEVRPIPMRSRVATGRVRLGRATTPSGRPVDVGLEPDELVRHLHVLGQTGTGKSTLLAALLHGLAAEGFGFTVLDPHGALVERVLHELPASAASRTWLIRSADLSRPVRLNPLAIEDEVRFEAVLQDLVLVFQRRFDPQRTGIVGPRFESMLTQGARGLRRLRGARASLLDVPLLFQDPSLQLAVLAATDDPAAIAFWRDIATLSETTRAELIGWFASKFDRFSTTSALRGILGTGAEAFDAARAIDDDRIVLVDLAKGALGEVAAEMLGFLHLARLWSGFERRTGTRPYAVVVDEAQTFDAGALPAMLAEGRKRGAAVVLAHQFLGQLRGGLGAAIDGNAATTAAFRVSPADARLLHDRFNGQVPLSRLTSADDLAATLHRAAAGWTAQPHTVTVDHSERVRPRAGLAAAHIESAVLQRTVRDLVHRAAGGDGAAVEAEPTWSPLRATPGRHVRVARIAATS